MTMISSIGQSVIQIFQSVGVFTQFVFKNLSLILKRRIRVSQLIEQMVYIGVNSIGITTLTALFVGMAFAIQVVKELLRFGAPDLIGGVVALAIWRELGPLLTGVVVAGRVGSAISAEIGSMKVTEQVEALEALSQDPNEYLVVPRVVAMSVMLPLLVGLADIVGYLGGFIVAMSSGKVNPYSYFASAQSMLVTIDIAGGLIKAFFFGLFIALYSSYMGLNATSGAKGVGKVTRGAVVGCLIAIFALNYFISVVIF